MDIIANNIANARTSRTETGQPYRRKELVVSTDDDLLGGVKMEDVVSDKDSPFQHVLMPGHPDADDQGYVEMPNVSLPREMIDMVTASRAYQANAAILKRYQRNVDPRTRIELDGATSLPFSVPATAMPGGAPKVSMAK